jgi:hypothetical protein
MFHVKPAQERWVKRVSELASEPLSQGDRERQDRACEVLS